MSAPLNHFCIYTHLELNNAFVSGYISNTQSHIANNTAAHAQTLTQTCSYVFFFFFFFSRPTSKRFTQLWSRRWSVRSENHSRKYYYRPDLCLKVFPLSVWAIPVALRNYLSDQSTAMSSTKPLKAKQERVLHYPAVLIYRANANKQSLKMHVLISQPEFHYVTSP